jgi:hypothetical protein
MDAGGKQRCLPPVFRGGFLLSLFFGPEYEGDTFFRNVG